MRGCINFISLDKNFDQSEFEKETDTDGETEEVEAE